MRKIIPVLRQFKFIFRTYKNVSIYHTFYCQNLLLQQVSSHQATSNMPPHTKVTLPALSPTMEKGTLAKWEKNEGDDVHEGDLLAEIETDKATVGLEASEEGYVAKILIPAGTKDIPLGKLLCIVVADKNDIEAFKNYKVEDDGAQSQAPATSGVSSPSESHAQDTEKHVPSTTETHGQESKKIQDMTSLHYQTSHQSVVPEAGGATPFAKALAAQSGISLSNLSGSGQFGAITGADILKQQSQQGHVQSFGSDEQKQSMISRPAINVPPHQSYNDLELTNMRQTIAKRLLHSKQSIPHYYLTMEIDMTQIEKARNQFNQMYAKENSNEPQGPQTIKLSVNDFIIKASAQACLHHRECNSAWMDTFIRQFNNVDVSVAVSTPAGLITPIIFNVESKGLKTISMEMKELAQRARQNKLKPQEFQGGTFTVSNLGMFGIDQFTAIINPPQSCILSIGSTQKRIVEDKYSQQGFKVIPSMKVTLGCDHRVVDGAIGAQWLKYFKSIMEDPLHMLL